MIRHTIAFRLKHPSGSAEETSFLSAGMVLADSQRGALEQ